MHQFDYQLDRHCSKTGLANDIAFQAFDYQLDRHCSKTGTETFIDVAEFDYQLDRHCSKTEPGAEIALDSLITS